MHETPLHNAAALSAGASVPAQRGLAMAFSLIFAPFSNMYDVIMPAYESGCPHGCADWTTVDQPALWADGKVPSGAGRNCAMPAAQSGAHECDCGEKDADTYMTDSYAGPWCFCADSKGEWDQFGETSKAYCTPPKSHVEQLNLQLAAPDTVVASFVTYEDLPTAPPVAMLGTSDNPTTQVTGVSHKYTPPGRTYIMHYIKFGNLKPRTTYYYKVKSGSSACGWSATFSFRSGYTSGVTKMATYGDMGHSHYNNMENMLEDCAAGRIDAILHMGDHAYNLGYSGDRRGDAYMNAMQPLLSGCAWYPVIGNHEASDGDHYNHYMTIAWGEVYGNDPPHTSSATSALGHLLSKGTMYASVHNAVPSNTSRYTATDHGLVHVIGLDLMHFDDTQVAWLEADLKAAAANRAAVPWIMASAHYPIYHASIQRNRHASAKHFLEDVGEAEIAGQPLPTFREPKSDETIFMTGPEPWHKPTTDGHAFVECAADDKECKTVGEWHAEVSSKLEPLLLKYGVDIFNAGHVHDYCSTFPMQYNKKVNSDFNSPKGPVHITEGNGGVPGVVGTYKFNDCTDVDWCRKHASGGAYGRFTFFNATHATYDHVQNNGGNVTDSFTIFQPKHGPFPTTATVEQAVA